MYRAVRDWSSWIEANVAEPEVVLRLGHWARWVGRRIAAGERVGVRQPEETLTNSVLLDLCRELPNLRVRTVGRAEESTVGADWEWWIEGPRQWFGALIQAKRLSENGTYGFNYEPRPSKRNPTPGRQVDRLIKTAEGLRIPALYVLYNNTEQRRPLYATSCAQQQLFPSGSAGVTVLSAYTARWLLQLNGNRPVSLADVAGYAVPWSCLASCPRTCEFGRPSPIGKRQLRLPHQIPGADRAADASAVAIRLTRSSRRLQFRAQTVAEQSGGAMLSGLHEEPPFYLPSIEDPSITDASIDHQSHDTLPRRIVALYRSEGGTDSDPGPEPLIFQGCWPG
ncbi:DUF6615 family protein [Nocardia fluminea]|uniref:DUF6615 family protein n=1 Tax=Nocardia fluminea TaxID=134984 RepID=UPI0036668780